MQVVLHVNGYYDWEPIPSDVKVTDEDIEAMRVKPGQNGEWLMKVEKSEEVRTQTLITIPEEELFVALVAEMTRGDKQPLTRAQAAFRYVARFHLDHNTHPDWIDEVEVHADPLTTVASAAGDAELEANSYEAKLRAYLATHVAAGNLQERDVNRLVKKYFEVSAQKDMVDHFHAMFEVPEEKISWRRETRAARKEAAIATHQKHLTELAAAAVEASKATQARRKNKKGAI